jgi:cytochrome P450
MINKWQSLLEQSKSTGFAVMDNPRIEMSRLTLDVVTYLSCGFDLNSVETDSQLTNQLAEFFNQINDLVIPSISKKLGRLVPGWDRKFRAAQAATVKVVQDMIQQTRQELSDEEAGIIDSGRSNLLKEMIRASRDDDSLTDQELVEEVLTSAHHFPNDPRQLFVSLRLWPG